MTPWSWNWVCLDSGNLDSNPNICRTDPLFRSHPKSACLLFVDKMESNYLSILFLLYIWYSWRTYDMHCVDKSVHSFCFLIYVPFIFLQYSENHISRSIYAAFKITNPSKSGMLDEFLPNVSLAIWTTTPWTIPANAGEVMPCLLYFKGKIQWETPFK